MKLTWVHKCMVFVVAITRYNIIIVPIFYASKDIIVWCTQMNNLCHIASHIYSFILYTIFWIYVFVYSFVTEMWNGYHFTCIIFEFNILVLSVSSLHFTPHVLSPYDLCMVANYHILTSFPNYDELMIELLVSEI